MLPSQDIEVALRKEWIHSPTYTIPKQNVQPASLDLSLGDVAYRLRCSFLPEERRVEDRLKILEMDHVDIRDGGILEAGRPYLIPLSEELALPDWIQAKTNPKSSTGRVDVFTRVITDHSHRFDEIAPGYSGRLWLEIVSRTFAIKVQRGLSLNQLRLRTGDARCRDLEIREAHAASPMLFDDAGPVPTEEVTLSDGLFLSISLDTSRGHIGYKAKRNSRLLDLGQIGTYEPGAFWEPLIAEPGGRLVLEPEEFYLLISKERVRIPAGFAAEMTAYDPTSGELRTHYAGFFDPGFGVNPPEMPQGSRAVLEVRAHDVPFMIEDGQRVCKLGFEHMVERPDTLYGAGLASNYQNQVVTLSKHFTRQSPVADRPDAMIL